MKKKKKIFSYPFSLPSPKRLNSWREIGNGWPISVSYTVQLSPCLGPICTFHRFCMLEGRVFRVHFSSITQSCPTLCNPMDCSIPGSLVHHQLPELAQTHVHWVGDAIKPSYPLSSPSPPAFSLSWHQGLFQWVSSSPKYQVARVFSFSISPSNEYSGLIYFRIDWLDLLAVQGTLKSLL